MNAGTIFDLILAVMFIFAIVRGWRQGALSAVVRLAGWVVAFGVIAVYSMPWAEQVYHVVVEPRAVAAVSAAIPADAVAAMNSGADALQTIQEALNTLSGILGGQTIDTSTTNAIMTMLQQDTGSLAQIITQTVLQPVLVNAVRIVLSILILVVCLFLARVLSRLTRARGRDSILSRTNRLVGGFLGFLEGAATGFMYVLVLYAIASFAHISWLTPAVLQGTKLVKMFL